MISDKVIKLLFLTNKRASKQEARVDYNQHLTQTSVNIKQAIVRWNNMYPIDRWWRNKHKVPLNSQQHRSMRMVDMKMEWEEDVLYNKITKSTDSNKKYTPGRGDWLKKREINQQMDSDQVDDLFDNVDINHIQQQEDGKIVV